MMDSGDDVLHTVPTYENYALLYAILHGFWLAVVRDVGRRVKEKLCYIAFDCETELKLPDGFFFTVCAERFRCTSVFFFKPTPLAFKPAESTTLLSATS